MAKTVVGLFDGRMAAQNAVRELMVEGFRGDEVSLVSKKPDGKGVEVEYVEEDGREQIEDMAKGAGTGAAIGAGAALVLSLTALSIPGIGPVLAAGPLAALIAGAGVGAAAGGLVSGLKRLGVEDDEAGTYAEGLKRGGTLVTVNTDNERADLAVNLLRRLGAVEIDKRAAEWREGGWRGFAETETLRPHVTHDVDEAVERRADRGAEITAEHEPVRAQALAGAPRGGTAADDEFAVPPPEVAIPVVAEELEVGKREVEGGGVRVQKRVSEIPVEEDVTLREEHVNVNRRPADYTFHGSDSEAFQESIVEIREAYEELILKKKARVVEEVVIHKDVDEHTETVRETLRKTEVEVEPLEPGRARGAASAGGDAGRAQDAARDRGEE
ncbi:MAG TPA: YsnF/AvaK domain-containing protein [Pyrinomonadaceae bacterium]|nr:YsnF/AvaK domain-containing protein [Pyrinomonadaceae bacterium]